MDTNHVIRRTARRFKNHLNTHQTEYLFGVIAVAAIYLQQTSRIEMYKFLESKGIDPMEFYCPEAYEELKN